MLGLGIDLVGVTRFTSLVEWSPHVKDFLIEDKTNSCQSVETLSANFALSESLFKALHSLCQDQETLKEILQSSWAKILRETQIKRIEGFPLSLSFGPILKSALGENLKSSISISHDGGFSLAVVIISKT